MLSRDMNNMKAFFWRRWQSYGVLSWAFLITTQIEANTDSLDSNTTSTQVLKKHNKIHKLNTSQFHDLKYRHITLEDAEKHALRTSNEVKAYTAQSNAALEQSKVQYAGLLPQWTLSGYFIYDTPNPKIEIPPIGAIPIQIRTIYFATTAISYPLWDTFSNLKAYRGAQFMAQSQKENEKNTRLQVLYNVRIAYLLVQLSLAQLSSVQDSLNVSRAQFNDIDSKYNAGAVARLDWIAAQREVLSYELQYEQQRSDVTSKVKDLFALMNLPTTVEIFQPETEIHTAKKTDTNMQFDDLEQTLSEVYEWHYTEPNEALPSLQSQVFLEKSYYAQAESEWAKLFPKIEISARASLIGANAFLNKYTEVNSFIASVSMPIFDGNRLRHVSAGYKQDALSARWNHDQLKINVDRDYQKALDLIQSLKKQKEINKMDIEEAKKSARLYYESYQAGQSIFINVQNSNLQVMLSEVQRANITAQILQQLYQIQLLSGKINI